MKYEGKQLKLSQDIPVLHKTPGIGEDPSFDRICPRVFFCWIENFFMQMI